MVTDGKGESQGGEGGKSSLLLGTRVRKDARLAERAIREEWGIDPTMREAIKERLLAIVKKKSVDIPCGEGVFPSESVADSNAIAAARVAATINAQDQADEHHLDNLNKPAAGTTVNVGVQVGGTSDASIALFYVESGIPEKMPPALLERYRAGEFD